MLVAAIDPEYVQSGCSPRQARSSAAKNSAAKLVTCDPLIFPRKIAIGDDNAIILRLQTDCRTRRIRNAAKPAGQAALPRSGRSL